MTSPITTIIFDLGNVLVKWDVYNLYKRFLPTREAVDSFLQEIRFFEWNAHQDAGRSFKEGVAELSAKFPQYAELIKAYDTYWEECVTEEIHGSVEIAKKLKSAGWDLYLLSNFSAETFPLVQKRFDFLSLFDDCIISGEHKLIKPDPAIYHLTLNRIKRKAQECLFIDDSLPNIEAAKKLNFYAIHFLSPAQLDTELKNLLGSEYTEHRN